MSRLTTAAERRIRSISRRPELPGWWPMLQVLIGVVFFVYLAYRAISGAPDLPPAVPSDTTALAQPGDSTPTTSPSAPSTMPTDTTAPPVSTEPVPGGPEVEVALAAGGTARVPGELVELARRSAAAAQGGPSESVAMVAGSSITQPADPWEDATGTEVLLVRRDDDEALFRVLVSSTESASAVWTTVLLVPSGPGWAFSPS